jgi:hypothetical protein
MGWSTVVVDDSAAAWHHRIITAWPPLPSRSLFWRCAFSASESLMLDLASRWLVLRQIGAQGLKEAIGGMDFALGWISSVPGMCRVQIGCAVIVP